MVQLVVVVVACCTTHVAQPRIIFWMHTHIASKVNRFVWFEKDKGGWIRTHDAMSQQS